MESANVGRGDAGVQRSRGEGGEKGGGGGTFPFPPLYVPLRRIYRASYRPDISRVMPHSPSPSVYLYVLTSQPGQCLKDGQGEGRGESGHQICVRDTPQSIQKGRVILLTFPQGRRPKEGLLFRRARKSEYDTWNVDGNRWCGLERYGKTNGLDWEARPDPGPAPDSSLGRHISSATQCFTSPVPSAPLQSEHNTARHCSKLTTPYFF